MMVDCIVRDLAPRAILRSVIDNQGRSVSYFNNGIAITIASNYEIVERRMVSNEERAHLEKLEIEKRLKFKKFNEAIKSYERHMDENRCGR
jgi:CO dehydrogenase/acetyl-CoA synthase delta subunit